MKCSTCHKEMPENTFDYERDEGGELVTIRPTYHRVWCSVKCFNKGVRDEN